MLFVNDISSLFWSSWTFLGTYQFLFCIITISFTLKIFLLFSLVRRGYSTTKFTMPLTLLLLVLTGGIFEDLSWFSALIRELISNKTTDIVNFIIRIAWALAIVKYQALALFIEGFTQKSLRSRLHQSIFLAGSSIFFFFFVFISIINFNLPFSKLETRISGLLAMYVGFFLMPISLFVSLWELYKTKIPKIMKRQLQILIKYFVLPMTLIDLIQTYPFHFVAGTLTNSLSFVGLSTITLTCAIYYSARRVMGLRFLNLNDHVISTKKIDFRKNFKSVLEQLGDTTNERELIHITKNFFKEAFSIPVVSTQIYIRNTNTEQKHDPESKQVLIEKFIHNYNHKYSISKLLKNQRIIVADELTFNNFYKKSDKQEQLMEFLRSIKADIFIAVYHKEIMVAYIVIDKNARENQFTSSREFYSDAECDHMDFFANHLGNTIKLLQNKNIDELTIKNRNLTAENKELKEELYNQHQKNNQYKESFRLFMRVSNQKKIGMMKYQSRRFVFCDTFSEELVNANPNLHAGHPIVKALKKIVKQVLEYKTQQTCIIKNQNNKEITLTAFPSNTKSNNQVAIFLYHANISDVLKNKMSLIDDPSTWDYFLYLETTKSGKLVNKIIPGSSPNILNFKIDVLKISLSKKAILLDMHDDDLMPVVEILHLISLREKLYILNLNSPSKNIEETTIKLFGINPLFGKIKKTPILEKLNGIGTLFIKNVHFLDIETQEHLAELIKYGYYRKFKANQKIECDIRIICSTSHDLNSLVQNGTFSKMFVDELNKTKLVLPSLKTFPKNELLDIVSDVANQKLENTSTKNILQFSEKEKDHLLRTCRITSFYDLKKRVELLMEKKIKKTEEVFDTSHIPEDYDPKEKSSELTKAIDLGKSALKDKKIMTFLWNKFKNQNKIAKLLNVNPSSVNRRCKKFNLIS